jgi:hypothetical protein
VIVWVDPTDLQSLITSQKLGQKFFKENRFWFR